MKRIISLGLVFSLALCSCSSKSDKNNILETVACEKHDLSTVVSFDGNVQSKNCYPVNSAVVGRVSSTSISEGDMVSEGDVLCTIDSSMIDLQIMQLEQQVSEEEKEYAEQLKAYQNKISNADRLKTAQIESASQGVSNYENTLSEVKKQLKAVKKAYSSAKSTYESYKKEYGEQLELQKEYTQLINQREDLIASLDSEDYEESSNTGSSSTQIEDSNSDILDLLSEFDLQILASEESLLSDEKLQELKLQVATAKENYDTLKVSKAEYEAKKVEAENALKSAKKTYTETKVSAQSNVSATEDDFDMFKESHSDMSERSCQLAQLYLQKEEYSIMAPASGVITYSSASKGIYVGTDVIFEIANLETLEVQVNVDAETILTLKEGDSVSISSDELSSACTGVISNVQHFTSTDIAKSSSQSDNKYSVTIDLDSDTPLMSGMDVEVTFNLNHSNSNISVPSEAVGSDDIGEYVMLVKSDDSKKIARKVYVKIGHQGNDYIEIISNDIALGDIVLADAASASDGDSIVCD